MTSNLKSRLICLIKIFNASAKLTCYAYTGSFEQRDAVDTMDAAYSDLCDISPEGKYWKMVDPKIGVIKLKKGV